jgi:hypothetical protein
VSPPPLRLIPNLGAEEGDTWRAHAGLPAVATARRLWRWLFAAPNTWLGLEQPEGEDWPRALGPRPEEPVFEWLDPRGAACAWLVSHEAAATARAAGLALAGPAPDVVQPVHDKEFAQQVARRAGLEPECLRGLCESLAPADLAEPDQLPARISARVDAWPAWTRRRFTLKPRFGSSGRGRVAGRIDDATLRGALPRLAARGGALLEPWLERSEDLSVLLHVPRESEQPIRVLACLRQHVTPSGRCLGHVGEIDSRGRLHSGSRHDETMREAAVTVARAAREQGFHGPCGVDGFAFTQPGSVPREWLRPVAELNARFTLGVVAAGILRRTLPWLRAETGLAPGERHAFYLGLDGPPGFPSWQAAQASTGSDSHGLALAHRDGVGSPGLLFARELASLLPLLAP